jgi:Tfp pilus assembly protein PilF
MSLLMKALEKAAKDRQEGAPSAGGADLTLEPMASAAPAAGTAPVTASSVGLPPRANPGGGAMNRDQSRAASVVNAGRVVPKPGLLSLIAARPVYAIGGLAGMFLAGYGVYVYLQIAHPGLLNNPFGASSVRAVAPPPAPVPAPSASTQGQVTGMPQTSSAPLAPPVLATGDSPPPGAPRAPDTPPPAQAGVGPAATLAAAAAAVATPAGAAPQPKPVPAAPPARPSRADTEPAPADPATADRSGIRVMRGTSGPSINPVLAEAYQSLERGNLEASQRLYNQVVRDEPRNIDALLGLAAISAQQGDGDGATRRYSRVLEIDPRNSTAQAGLLGAMGAADPLAAESRLKQLIAREPTSFLYFTLGNLYAEQNRWSQAQQAYFQAFSMEPGNPDYAYNLAVGLEHLNQPRPALNYYRQAVKLAQARGSANFSVPGAQARIGVLEKSGAE